MRPDGEPRWRDVESTRLKKEPLHVSLAVELNRLIENGTFGYRLPPMEELAERFGVGRLTARDAILHLRDQGVVKVRQGQGTFTTAGASLVCRKIPKEPQFPVETPRTVIDLARTEYGRVAQIRKEKRTLSSAEFSTDNGGEINYDAHTSGGGSLHKKFTFDRQGKFVGVSVERTTGSFVYQLSFKRGIDGKFGIEKQGWKSV